MRFGFGRKHEAALAPRQFSAEERAAREAAAAKTYQDHALYDILLRYGTMMILSGVSSELEPTPEYVDQLVRSSLERWNELTADEQMALRARVDEKLSSPTDRLLLVIEAEPFTERMQAGHNG